MAAPAQVEGSAGASSAAAEALRQVEPAVRRFLWSLLRNGVDVDDAFSAFAERFWRGFGGFRGDCSLRAWAYRIARNVACNLRDDAYRRLGRQFASGEASAIAAEARTSSGYRMERQRAAFEHLRGKLSFDDRSLLTLRLDQRLPWAEIGAILASGRKPWKPERVAKRYERLRQRLAQMAREEGLVEWPPGGRG
jgi:RNA polymerase sigma-70 factor (ECF subfamily)